jgi:hypothetical protein
MSIVPTATERAPCPPGFSLVIIAAQIRSESRFWRVPSSSDIGSASMIRGAKRSRINPPRSRSLHIGNNHDQADGHLAEIDMGVADR